MSERGRLVLLVIFALFAGADIVRLNYGDVDGYSGTRAGLIFMIVGNALCAIRQFYVLWSTLSQAMRE